MGMIENLDSSWNDSKSTPSHPRRRSPLASFHGMPDACTVAEGAWPTMRIRDAIPARTIGRGPSGRCCSHARHARTSVNRSSRKEGCCSLTAAASFFVHHDIIDYNLTKQFISLRDGMEDIPAGDVFSMKQGRRKSLFVQKSPCYVRGKTETASPRH